MKWFRWSRPSRALSNPFTASLGARSLADGRVHFSLFCRHAARVWLLLFDRPDAEVPTREIPLDPAQHRRGDLWHIQVDLARPGQWYVYRVEGRTPGPLGHKMDPGQWLLDPYAHAVSGPTAWGDRQRLAAGEVPRRGARFPKAEIVRHDFDWSTDRAPAIPLRDLIVYELHLRGYTANPNAGVRHPGTYAGLIERIPYLKDLGVNAVELLPIQEFDEVEYWKTDDPRRSLRNYWGYSTRAFFAPHPRYAARPTDAVNEFKHLVLALHQAGIEVILDVVFNHTGENGAGGPTYSFRGLGNEIYYLLDERHHYLNYSGCGNTVNCNHPVVRGLILDCLRHWVCEYRVDGFRFDLASILARGRDGELMHRPPLIEAIEEDPLLRDTKLFAEAWDGGGAYQVGRFPGRRWAEWNGRFRDDVRSFWRGDHHKLGAFAHRLAGSADLYDHTGQTPLKSVNFVTCHDGFTLHDLVSYNERHNEANLERNRDGERHNFSHNHGHEGPTRHPAILAARLQQMKNLLLTTLLSRGIPLLLAGDEFGRTQRGNNNAYCQDNLTSWIDWSLVEAHAELLTFARRAIVLRKRYAVLRQARFFQGKRSQGGRWPDIQWCGPDGKAPDWEHGQSVASLLSGESAHLDESEADDSLLILYHAAIHPVSFVVPPAPGHPWQIVLFTPRTPPVWQQDEKRILVDGRSITVLASRREGRLR